MTVFAFPFPYSRARRWMRMTACSPENERPLAINILEEKEAFLLQALTPGLSPEDIQIQVLDDIITIEGRFPEREGNYLLQELPGGEFRRVLRLPATVDADKVDARLEAGILTLRLPKSEAARTKSVPITAR